MKVVIAGSRKFDTSGSIGLVDYAVEQSGFLITEVVSGHANGIDKAGELWVDTWPPEVDKPPITIFKADWKKHGKAAGPIRNEEMAKYADAAIIIWDGESKGTLNTIQHFQKMKKPYYRMVVEEMREDVKPITKTKTDCT